ncbi:MAG: GNAT family N-acetyltransferase [Planctomycetaceae bacterium]|jgi:GNAT superfamily N-acetyltransferase|nr:GNAT family N-acetyltransferase [Planctomycetaceae bacterium]
MDGFTLRAMSDGDRAEVAEVIYGSINAWYNRHGMPDIFRGGPSVTEIFYDVYNAIEPGCTVVAENDRTGRLMGSCFYHPREHHVSLGIMTVHPNHFGRGVGSSLLEHIIEFTEQNGFSSLRLTQSALNLDSFSLYNKAGFVPRYAYQDMLIEVPGEGVDVSTARDADVRQATGADVDAMAGLEREVSGISRCEDYRYCVENALDIWSVAVCENSGGSLDGWMISCGHTAMNMLGPCVARDEETAAALIRDGLNRYPGRTPVFLVPMEKSDLVQRMYSWGARNCEMHFCQVRGDWQPFDGVNMPSFLPETG